MKDLNWLIRKLFYFHKSTPLSDMPAQELPQAYCYDVPYIKQQHVNMCVDASLAMINHFLGKPISSMSKNPRGIFEGHEYDVQGFETAFIKIDDLKNNIRNHGPLILTIPLKYGFDHAVVCIGYTEDSIIYHDPIAGSAKTIKLEELQRINHHAIEELRRANPQLDLPIEETIGINRLLPAPQNLRLKDLNQDKHFATIPIKSKYADFFGLKSKHYDPVDAIVNFLKDYANASRLLHPFRHHRHEVNLLIKAIQHKATEVRSNPANKEVAEDIMLKFIQSELANRFGNLANKPAGLLTDRLADRIEAIQTIIGPKR